MSTTTDLALLQRYIDTQKALRHIKCTLDQAEASIKTMEENIAEVRGRLDVLEERRRET